MSDPVLVPRELLERVIDDCRPVVDVGNSWIHADAANTLEELARHLRAVDAEPPATKPPAPDPPKPTPHPCPRCGSLRTMLDTTKSFEGYRYCYACNNYYHESPGTLGPGLMGCVVDVRETMRRLGEAYFPCRSCGCLTKENLYCLWCVGCGRAIPPITPHHGIPSGGPVVETRRVTIG